jgi:hypothetical protein
MVLLDLEVFSKVALNYHFRPGSGSNIEKKP